MAKIKIPKGMKYRRYDNTRMDMDPIQVLPEEGKTYRVYARRRKTAGNLLVAVKASSPEEADRKIREGQVLGIGLGWIPYLIEEADA